MNEIQKNLKELTKRVTVKKVQNNKKCGRVYLPKEWIGQRVAVVVL